MTPRSQGLPVVHKPGAPALTWAQPTLQCWQRSQVWSPAVARCACQVWPGPHSCSTCLSCVCCVDECPACPAGPPTLTTGAVRRLICASLRLDLKLLQFGGPAVPRRWGAAARAPRAEHSPRCFTRGQWKVARLRKCPSPHSTSAGSVLLALSAQLRGSS